jgi:hypothetical protein
MKSGQAIIQRWHKSLLPADLERQVRGLEHAQHLLGILDLGHRTGLFKKTKPMRNH